MLSALKLFALCLLVINSLKISFAQQNEISVSGFINDKITGEVLVGTNILVYSDSLNVNGKPVYGTAANNYGYYIIPKLQKKKYYIIFRYIGYKVTIKELDLTFQEKDYRFNLFLESEDIKLSEVVVEGKRIDKNAISTIDVSPELLTKLPSFSGEVDLFRMLQLLPGINKASETANGLYIRGGSPDQTLTLIDGAISYNPSHIGNIASTFNSNAIRDIVLIKGAFPAEYGGRMGSVLDIKLRSGTKQKETGTLGLGTINSFFSLEGPLGASSTYMVAGRYMYYDKWQNNFNEESSVPRYNFYDLNGKVNYNISETSSLSISTMYSKDKMYSPVGDEIVYDVLWENLNIGLNWIQINSKSLFLNSSLNFVDYNFSSKIGIGAQSVNSASYFSNPNLTDIILKQTAEVNWELSQKLKTGFEIAFHNYDLLYNEYYDLRYEEDPYAGQNINSLEAALFVQNESEFFGNLKTNIGGRLFYFADTEYFNFEPRFSLSYLLFKDFFIKGAVASANQFLHLITRNDISLPTDLWYPSTDAIKPGKSTQYVFGFDSYLSDDTYQASVETYYRDMENLYEFKNSPKLNPLDDSIEDQFISGEGEAYGVELFFQKRKGDFTGWIGYTLSWSKRKFSSLNNGKVFYPKYDRRHDLSVTAAYKVDNNLTLGATFTYAMGMWYTLPPGQYIFSPVGITGNDEILLSYGSLNSSKFPDYHRLDIIANYNLKLDKIGLNFFVNLYNVYNRHNALAQYVVFNEDENSTSKLKRISLFPFIPAIGLSITF